MTWTARTLGEIARQAGGEVRTGPFGSQLHKSDYVDDLTATPVVMPKDMVDGRVDPRSIARVDDRVVERLCSHVLRTGDIVLGRRGEIGRRAWTGDVEDGWLCGTGSMRITINGSTEVRPRFLFYYLGLPQTIGWLQGHAVGATMSNLSAGVVQQLPVRYPRTAVQDAIIEVLDAVENLIDNNRRRIEILEEMARLLYREWLVHFRFPGHEDVALVDSELGPIPEGWRWRNLFDLADVGFGFSFKSNRFADAGPIRVVRIRDVPNNTTSTYTDEDPGERYEIHNGDTLIGMDGDFHMCRWADGLAHLNQRVARLRSKGQLSQLLLHLALEQPIQRFNQTIIGTTVAHLGKRHLKEIFIAEPSSPVLATVNKCLQPIFQLDLNLHRQDRALREARDLLLPRLVSGELDASELELGVAAV